MNESAQQRREANSRSLVIERATVADAEAVCDVRDQAWLATCTNEDLGITEAVVRTYLDGNNGELIPKKIQRWRDSIALDDSQGATFVARQGGAIKGFVGLNYKDGRRWLSALYVLPESQGWGIGSQLMQKALQWFGQTEDIYLQVVSYNQPAIDFYERFGFEQTGVEVKDLTKLAVNKFLPALEMVLRAGKV